MAKTPATAAETAAAPADDVLVQFRRLEDGGISDPTPKSEVNALLAEHPGVFELVTADAATEADNA